MTMWRRRMTVNTSIAIGPNYSLLTGHKNRSVLQNTWTVQAGHKQKYWRLQDLRAALYKPRLHTAGSPMDHLRANSFLDCTQSCMAHTDAWTTIKDKCAGRRVACTTAGSIFGQKAATLFLDWSIHPSFHPSIHPSMPTSIPPSIGLGSVPFQFVFDSRPAPVPSLLDSFTGFGSVHVRCNVRFSCSLHIRFAFGHCLTPVRVLLVSCSMNDRSRYNVCSIIFRFV